METAPLGLMGGYGTWAVTWGHDGDRRGQGGD